MSWIASLMATLLKPQLKQSPIVTAIAVASSGRDDGEGGTAGQSICSRLSFTAMRANAGDFDQRTAWRKAGRARRGFQRLGSSASRRFADSATTFANQENDKIAGAMIVHARDEGVAAFDAVNEIVVAQKIERSINRDRRRTRLLLQAVNDFIGAKRAMAAQQNFKHLAAHRGESLGAHGTLRFRMCNGSAGAARMIVIGSGENCGRHDGLVLGPARRRRSAYALVFAGLFCTSLVDCRSLEKKRFRQSE